MIGFMGLDRLWNRFHGQQGRRVWHKYRKVFQVGCEAELKEDRQRLEADLGSKKNSF